MENGRGSQGEVITPLVILFFGDAAVCQLVLHGLPILQESPDRAAWIGDILIEMQADNIINSINSQTAYIFKCKEGMHESDFPSCCFPRILFQILST